VGVVIILVWLPGRAEVPVETRAAAEASPIATPLVGGAAD
jgi:hypothetical protein